MNHHRELLFLLLAAAVASAPLARSWYSGDADDAAVVAWLERRLPQVRLKDATLHDALAFLNDDVPPVDLIVEWDALATFGVTPDTRLSARLRDVKRDKILRTILAEVGGGVTRLGYAVEAGRVVISTEQGLYSRATSRRYDVRDLMRGARRSDTEGELAGAILGLFCDIVASETWRCNGGAVADIRYDEGWMVVTQIDENHRAVARLLDQLRDTRKNPLPVITCEFPDLGQ